MKHTIVLETDADIEQVQKALENSTAREALSEALNSEVSLQVRLPEPEELLDAFVSVHGDTKEAEKFSSRLFGMAIVRSKPGEGGALEERLHHVCFYLECGQENRRTGIFGPFSFLQFTDNELRIGPNGESVAYYTQGEWMFHSDAPELLGEPSYAFGPPDDIEFEAWYSDIVITPASPV